MLKTEQVKLDLFKLEQMIINKKNDAFFITYSNEELDKYYEGIKKASNFMSSVVTDEISKDSFEATLAECGVNDFQDFLYEIDDSALLQSLYD